LPDQIDRTLPRVLRHNTPLSTIDVDPTSDYNTKQQS
jgi:hypothetical protein